MSIATRVVLNVPAGLRQGDARLTVIIIFMWFVYVLKCSDGNHYTGCTQNIHARIEKHQSGHVPATKGRLPVELITYIAFADKFKAFAFEKYLKGGSGRAFLRKRLV